MIILGLDASSAVYGYCVFDTETMRPIEVGSLKLKTSKKDQSEVDLYSKLEAIFSFISALRIKFNPEVASIEDLFLKNVGTLETLSEVRGATRLALGGVPLVKIPTTTMKSEIGLTGALKTTRKDEVVAIEKATEWTDMKGTIKTITVAKKKDLIRELKKQIVLDLVNKKFDLSLTINDESDAVAIAYTYCKKYL